MRRARTANQALNQTDPPPTHLLQTVTIKTINPEPTRGLAEKKDAGAAGGGAGGSKPGGTSGVTQVGASPFAALGSLGAGVTVLGGAGGLGGLALATVGASVNSARDRAAAAAKRVPSPEPGPRKQKSKKLTWVAETQLVGVRWFLKVRAREGCVWVGACRSCSPGGCGQPLLQAAAPLTSTQLSHQLHASLPARPPVLPPARRTTLQRRPRPMPTHHCSAPPAALRRRPTTLRPALSRQPRRSICPRQRRCGATAARCAGLGLG